MRDIQTIAHLAEQEEAKAQKELVKIGMPSGTDDFTEAARASLDSLRDRLDKMEVFIDATN